MEQLNHLGQDSRRIEKKNEDISKDDLTLPQLQGTNFINKNTDICERVQRQVSQERVIEQLLQAQMMPPHHKRHYSTAIQEQSLYDTTISESEAWSSSSVSVAQPSVDSFDPDLIPGAEKCTNWAHYSLISKQLPWIESNIPPVALHEPPRYLTGQKNDTKQNSSYSNNDNNPSPSFPCQKIIAQLERQKSQDCLSTFASIGSNIKSVQETNFDHNLDDLVGEILNSLPHSQPNKTPKIDMKKDLMQKSYKANSFTDKEDMHSMCQFPLASQSNFPEIPESLIPQQYFNPLPQYSNQQSICNLKSKWSGAHNYGRETSVSPQDTIYKMTEPPLDDLHRYKQQPGLRKSPVIKTNKFGGIKGAPSLNTSYWDLPLDPLCTASFYEDWPITQHQKYIWAQQISQITNNLELHENPNVMSQHSLLETNSRESTSIFPIQEVPIIPPDTTTRNQNTHRRENLCGVASDISTSTIDETVSGNLNAEEIKLKVGNAFGTKGSDFCQSFFIDDSIVPLQSTKVLVDNVGQCDKPYDYAADGTNLTHNGKGCHQNVEMKRQNFFQTESGESELIPSNLIQPSVVEPETIVFQNPSHEIGSRSTGISIKHVSPVGQKPQLIQKHEAQSCDKNQKKIHQETSKLCNFKKDKIFQARRGNPRFKLAPQNQSQRQHNYLEKKRQFAMGTPDNNVILDHSNRDGTNNRTSTKIMKEDSREPSNLKIQTENLNTTKELNPTRLDSSFSFQAVESLHLKMRTDSYESSVKRASPLVDTDSMTSVKRRNLNE
ncbi:putative Bgh-specific protein [Blumeria hordei DH14]|uniref:Putative Bgh-specific protein n=1 Tax=Blumeria graminis f. sp. hordei (strain DH14) TaxID=546991 RepID=N1JAU8_BLUG1|nr:putative Bgh-specific protein [Blumeria hordei DH14]